VLNKVKTAKYFTKLDIRWAFNNIRIKEGDEYKAAFICSRGLFCCGDARGCLFTNLCRLLLRDLEGDRESLLKYLPTDCKGDCKG